MFYSPQKVEHVSHFFHLAHDFIGSIFQTSFSLEMHKGPSRLDCPFSERERKFALIFALNVESYLE